MRLIPLSCLLISIFSSPLSAGPNEELKDFSLFKSLDSSSLTPESILTQRLGSMSFRRGISVQSCFLTEAPMAKTLEVLRTWDPSSHQILNVLHHQALDLPIAATGFSGLVLTDEQKAEKWLIEKSSSSDILNSLYLSKAEVSQHPTKPIAAEVSQFWTTVLTNRAQSFFSTGLKGLPSYDFGGNSYRSDEELKSLLQEMPPLANRFLDFLNQTVFSNTPSASTFTPHGYWELLSVQDEGTFNLGATFAKAEPTSSVMVDCQYYVNSSYFVNLMIYQLWPITYQGHDYTFIWRCDLIASPTLSEYRGIERLAAENLTIRSVKEAIHSFQEDVRQRK